MDKKSYLDRVDEYVDANPNLASIKAGFVENAIMVGFDITNTLPMVVEMNGVETFAIGVLDGKAKAIRILAVAPHHDWGIKVKLIGDEAIEAQAADMAPDQNLADLIHPNT